MVSVVLDHVAGCCERIQHMATDPNQTQADLPPWRRTLDDGSPYWTKHYQPGVPAEIELPTKPLTTLLETAVREGGSHVATDFFGAEMTYRQLGDRVARAAEGLRRLGVRAGDRVALLLPNCLKLGSTPNLVGPRSRTNAGRKHSSPGPLPRRSSLARPRSLRPSSPARDAPKKRTSWGQRKTPRWTALPT